MSDISERIMRTIKRKNISYGELSNMTGIAKSALQRYATGETEKIPLPRLEKIADALCVNAAYLMGWEESLEDNVPGAEDNIPGAENIIPMPKMNTVPLVGTIACGTPILAVENIEDQVDIPEHIHADFALRCKGDSMIDVDIQDGDIVYIRQQDEVNPGQIAAVLVEDEATLKRFYYDEAAGVVTLVPANSAMPPQVYHGETLNHIKILGLVVGLTRSIKQ